MILVKVVKPGLLEQLETRVPSDQQDLLDQMEKRELKAIQDLLELLELLREHLRMQQEHLLEPRVVGPRDRRRVAPRVAQQIALLEVRQVVQVVRVPRAHQSLCRQRFHLRKLKLP